MIDCAMNKKYINQIGTCKQSYKALACCATIHTAYRTALERVFVLFVFGGGGWGWGRCFHAVTTVSFDVL